MEQQCPVIAAFQGGRWKLEDGIVGRAPFLKGHERQGNRDSSSLSFIWSKTLMLRAHKGLIRGFPNFENEIQIDKDFEIYFFLRFLIFMESDVSL